MEHAGNPRSRGLTARIVSLRHAVEALLLAVSEQAGARILDLGTYGCPASEIYKLCYQCTCCGQVNQYRITRYRPAAASAMPGHASAPIVSPSTTSAINAVAGGIRKNSADTRDASP